MSQPLHHRLLRHYASHPLRLLSFTLKSTLLYHLITTHLYHIEPTHGASMLPTISVMGDWVLISKLHRRGRDVKVGDIVAFDSVVHAEERVIKRVIGLGGDLVLRDTPGSSEGGGGSMIQVPEGHCWVVGDNLPYSRDSRHFGPMPMALIRGKVLGKVFPFSERHWFEDGLTAVE